MLLKYFYDQELAQASYMVGCAQTGEAMIIDPARAVQPYLDAAEREGLQISHVTETHIHADFVSGTRELNAATGATMYLSDMGDDNWKYTFAAHDQDVILVRDRDSWMVGNIKVEVLHTPGHTPEHISLLITDTAGADKPIGVFTGDFIFVGDVGRPDLLEEAAGMAGTAASGAALQFQSVNQFKKLPDYLQIWPGHGAGSACGKALGSIPSTTLGYEKLFNPAFQFEDEATFSRWLLQDQPAAPRYFAQMKKVNKAGPTLLKDLTAPVRMDRTTLDELLADDTLVFDLRNREAFADAHVPGTISIAANNRSYTTYIGWFVDYTRPFYFIAPSVEAVPELLTSLRAIGIDEIAGYFGPEVAATGTESLPRISAQELATRLPQNGIQVVDVRQANEYAEEHIVGADNIVLWDLSQHLAALTKNRPIITHCAGGYRAQIAASLLRAKGFQNTLLLDEPKSVWAEALETKSER